MDPSIELKMIDNLFKLIFENKGIICGSPIREYVLPSKDNKVCPTELYIYSSNTESFYKNMLLSLKFCFDIRTENYHKNVIMYINYKFHSDIKFNLHIYPQNFPIPNMIIDVNNFIMAKPDNYTVPKDTSIIDIVNKINTKQFNILQTFKIPKGNRRQIGIVESSTNLLSFIETMYHVCQMLENYWILENQYIEEIFEPCLMKKAPEGNSCDICSEEFNKYELELNCCKKMICFQCAINQIRTRFDNSEINCPFCRGDLFGWKTNKMISDKTYIDDFDDMPPLEESHTNYGDIRGFVTLSDLNAPITSSMLQDFHHIDRYSNNDDDIPDLVSASENTDILQIRRNEFRQRMYANMLYGQLGAPHQTLGRSLDSASHTSIGIQRVREILNQNPVIDNSINHSNESINESINEMEMVD